MRKETGLPEVLLWQVISCVNETINPTGPPLILISKKAIEIAMKLNGTMPNML